MTDGFYNIYLLKRYPSCSPNELAVFSGTTFDSYIDTYSFSETQTKHAFRLGDPIHVFSSIVPWNEVVKLVINEDGTGRNYVCDIDAIDFITHDHVQFSYHINWMETIYNGFHGTDGFKIRDAHVSRICNPSVPSGLTPRSFIPFQPSFVTAVKSWDADGAISFMYVRRTTDNRNIIGVMKGTKSNSVTNMIKYLMSGAWVELVSETINESDVWVTAIIPLSVDTASASWVDVSTEFATTFGMITHELDIGTATTILDCTEYYNGANIDSDPRTLTCFKDMRGNVVWQATPYKDYSSTNVLFTVGVSVSNIIIKASIDDETITMPTDSVDMIVDAWKEYYYRQRATDINLRNLTIETTYKQNMVGSLNSALGGGIGGAMTGNPIGAVAGAIGGLATGLVGGVINNKIQTDAGIKEQSYIDNDYRRANDSLSLIGSFNYAIYEHSRFGFYEEHWDDASKQAFQYDTIINGNYVDFYANEITFDPTNASNTAIKCDGVCYYCGGKYLNAIASTYISDRLREGIRTVRV